MLPQSGLEKFISKKAALQTKMFCQSSMVGVGGWLCQLWSKENKMLFASVAHSAFQT